MSTSPSPAPRPASGKESASIDVERNLRILARGGLALFAALTLTLFLVQLVLGRQMANLENVALERQGALNALESSVSALFRRETQLLSTTQTSQLAPLVDRTSLEAQFREAREALARAAFGGEGDALARDAEAMLAADKELFTSVSRRHEEQASFEKQLADVSVQLRATMEQVNAISGIAHLGFIRVLRRLASNDANGAAVHELVFGEARAQQEISSDLVAHILNLGVLVGKIGLAPNADTLNSIMANEIAQNVSATRDKLEQLDALVTGQAEVAPRARALRAAYDAIIPRIVAEDHPDAMIALRRAYFAQQKRAEGLRQSALQKAGTLASSVALIQGQVRADAARAVARADQATWLARVVSLLLLAAGIVLGWQAARRIRASFRGLRESNEVLEKLKEELVGVNVNLEGLVAQRTKALEQRERAMRLILDHTVDGLISLDKEGRTAGEVSQAARRWFGEPARDQHVATYLFTEPREAAMFQLAFTQLTEDELPFEVSAGQLPDQFARQDRLYALSYNAIREGETLQGVLLAVRDVTEQRAAERREEEARELQTVIGYILRSPQGFRTFLDETERWLETLASCTDLPLVMRALHTLKGSAAIYGLASVARICHDLESAVTASESWDSHQVEPIAAAWQRTLSRLGKFVERDQEHIDVGPSEVQVLQDMLQKRAEHAHILEVVHSWTREPMRSVLERLGAQAKRIAPSLGKEIEVHIDCDGLRPPRGLTPFLSSLVHVLRNAVDHGIELPREREALGKTRTGNLWLSSFVRDDGTCEITVKDDGGGVDFAQLRKKAEELGLPHESESELLATLFVDGLSTRDEVTELSGRGVGLGAVRDATSAVGAAIQISSGHLGTTFTFIVPRHALAEGQKAPRASASKTLVGLTPVA